MLLRICRISLFLSVSNAWTPKITKARDFTIRGCSLTTLTRRGRQVVLYISSKCRFSLITVGEFLQNVNQGPAGVGRWSKRGQNLVNVVKECPLIGISFGGQKEKQENCALSNLIIENEVSLQPKFFI